MTGAHTHTYKEKHVCVNTAQMLNWSCALSTDSPFRVSRRTTTASDMHHMQWTPSPVAYIKVHGRRCVPTGNPTLAVQTHWTGISGTNFFCPRDHWHRQSGRVKPKLLTEKGCSTSVKSHWSFTVVFEVLFCSFFGTVYMWQLPMCLKFCSVHFLVLSTCDSYLCVWSFVLFIPWYCP